LLFSFALKAQQINIDADDKPLNEVFIDLKDQYKIQFSFNDKLLSTCSITKHQTYNSIDDAITDLISGYHLIIKKRKDVFIIKKDRSYIDPQKLIIKKKSAEDAVYSIHCQIVDKYTMEPLPYASMGIGGIGFHTDNNGKITFQSIEILKQITVSYLGYYFLDTVINLRNSKKIVLPLIPFRIGLEEVIVEAAEKPIKTLYGLNAGLLKINHQIATFLPGNNNNTVFNFLRLQPGIMASGEQDKDYFIWGTYKGQTLISYNGMTIFSISNFNGDLGVVNPLLIKELNIYKGAFDVSWFDRAGGIVEMIGKDGDPNNFHFNINASNQLSNVYLNIPIAGNQSIQIGGRQTYSNFIPSESLLKGRSKRNRYLFESEYNFKDINLKYTLSTKKNNKLKFSVFRSQDNNWNTFDEEELSSYYYSYQKQGKSQYGGSLNYNHNWNKIGQTNMLISSSGLNSRQWNIQLYEKDEEVKNKVDYIIDNHISETKLKLDHQFPILNKHSLSAGIAYSVYSSGFRLDSADLTNKYNRYFMQKAGLYLQDNITANNKLEFQPGVRIDLMNNKFYLQPRIRASYKPVQSVRINLASGVYNQFITESAIIDEFGNQFYSWGLCSNELFPVIHSLKTVAGVSWISEGSNINIEAFHKTTKGLSRFYHNNDNLELSTGNAVTKGIDIYFSKQIKKHNFWVAYTLSETEELFTYFDENEYSFAPQDQRHEIKGAAIFNLKPFYFSVNYVYGSGFAGTYGRWEAEKRIPYNRFDAAILYKLKTKKLNIETGVSVLNVFNSKNVLYNDFAQFPDQRTVYQSATSFTPLVFLNLGF
jgi:hypothetical protein